MLTQVGGNELLDAHTGRSGGAYPHPVYLMLLSGMPANPMTATPTDWRNLEQAVAWPEQTRFRVDTAVSSPTVVGSAVQCSFPASAAVNTSPATVAPASAIAAYAFCDAASGLPTKVWGGEWFDGPVTVSVGDRFQIDAGGIVWMVG